MPKALWIDLSDFIDVNFNADGRVVPGLAMARLTRLLHDHSGCNALILAYSVDPSIKTPGGLACLRSLPAGITSTSLTFMLPELDRTSIRRTLDSIEGIEAYSVVLLEQEGNVHEQVFSAVADRLITASLERVLDTPASILCFSSRPAFHDGVARRFPGQVQHFPLASMGQVWPKDLARFQEGKAKIFEIITDFDGTLFMESWTAYLHQTCSAQLDDIFNRWMQVLARVLPQESLQTYSCAYKNFWLAQDKYKYLYQLLDHPPCDLGEDKIFYQTTLFACQDRVLYRQRLDALFNDWREKAKEKRVDCKSFESRYGSAELSQQYRVLEDFLDYLKPLRVLSSEEISRAHAFLEKLPTTFFFQRILNPHTYQLYQGPMKENKLLASSSRSPEMPDDVSAQEPCTVRSVALYGGVQGEAWSRWNALLQRLIYIDARRHCCSSSSDSLDPQNIHQHRLLKLVFFTAMYILRGVARSPERGMRTVELFDDQSFETHPDIINACNEVLKKKDVYLCFRANSICHGGENLSFSQAREEHEPKRSEAMRFYLYCTHCAPSKVIEAIVDAYRKQYGDAYDLNAFITVVSRVYEVIRTERRQHMGEEADSPSSVVSVDEEKSIPGVPHRHSMFTDREVTLAAVVTQKPTLSKLHALPASPEAAGESILWPSDTESDSDEEDYLSQMAFG